MINPAGFNTGASFTIDPAVVGATKYVVTPYKNGVAQTAIEVTGTAVSLTTAQVGGDGSYHFTVAAKTSADDVGPTTRVPTTGFLAVGTLCIVTNCITYAANTCTCATCDAGYWLDSNTCTTCTVAGCSTYTANTCTCTACSTGEVACGRAARMLPDRCGYCMLTCGRGADCAMA